MTASGYHAGLLLSGVTFTICGSQPVRADSVAKLWHLPVCPNCLKKLEALAEAGHAHWRNAQLVDYALFVCREHEL